MFTMGAGRPWCELPDDTRTVRKSTTFTTARVWRTALCIARGVTALLSGPPAETTTIIVSAAFTDPRSGAAMVTASYGRAPEVGDGKTWSTARSRRVWSVVTSTILAAGAPNV